ncbi:universal stress protein [Luteococcus sp. OSA5]|uniref:universal stress protein n=1 Tax=Luteococcus sp. OSA5 TaxID=3401630 RepID=UPI003B42E406
MKDITRIVVGTDGSPEAWNVANWAAGQAERQQVPLQVLRSVELPTVESPGAELSPAEHWYSPDVVDEVRSQATEQLDGVVARIRDQYPGIQVERELLVGHPARTVLDSTQPGDLLVVGRSHMTGLLGRMVGSTTEEVLTHARVPVVVVPPTEHDATGPVVVGVDQSSSQEAFVVALEWSLERNLPLLAVAANDFDKAFWARQSPSLAEKRREQLETEQVRLLQPLVDQQPGASVRVAVVDGEPVTALRQASQGASLLVVGSRGRGGFSGLLLGSTSRSLGRECDVPLLVVPNVKD